MTTTLKQLEQLCVSMRSNNANDDTLVCFYREAMAVRKDLTVRTPTTHWIEYTIREDASQVHLHKVFNADRYDFPLMGYPS